jgi:hypothetical protein
VHLNEADHALLAGADPLAPFDTSPFAALRLRAQPAFADTYLRLLDTIEKEGIRSAPAMALASLLHAA